MFRADALSVCRALLPTWSGVLDARLEPITGGITNTLRKVVPSVFFEKENENGTNEPSPSEPGPVVLRVFAAGHRSVPRPRYGERGLGGAQRERVRRAVPGRVQKRTARGVSRTLGPRRRRRWRLSASVSRSLTRRCVGSTRDARARAFRGSPTREHLPKTIADLGHHAFVARGGDERRGGARDPRLAALGLEDGAHSTREAATARAADAPTALLHNDALAGNVALPAGYRPGSRELGHEPPTVTLIDFEYSCYGRVAGSTWRTTSSSTPVRVRLASVAFAGVSASFCAAYLGDEAANEAAVEAAPGDGGVLPRLAPVVGAVGGHAGEDIDDRLRLAGTPQSGSPSFAGS